MTEEKKIEINNILGKAKWILLFGFVIIFIIPILLIQPNFHNTFNFSQTGQIGDTIGGTTAPFLNLVGAALVFYALKAQVKANELIQEQIDKENIEKEKENESLNLNQLYAYLEQSINNFNFKSLPEYNLKNVSEIELNEITKGGEAFYKLFSQIYCNYHGTLQDLIYNQSISELYSILTIMDLLLIKLAKTNSNNKEILTTLTKHQFEYKIITRIRDFELNTLQKQYCGSCECDHGLPDELIELIGRIKQKLN